MSNRLSVGFTGGVLGALALVLVMYAMDFAGFNRPAFLDMYRAVFGANPPMDHIISAILFLLSGGIWGMIFAAFVKHPTTLKGFAFGILPTLFLWVVINPIIGKPMFNDFTFVGIIMPILFNMVIWGTFIGVYCSYNYKTETAA